MNKFLILGAMVGIGLGIAKFVNKNKKETQPENAN